MAHTYKTAWVALLTLLLAAGPAGAATFYTNDGETDPVYVLAADLLVDNGDQDSTNPGTPNA